MIHVIVCEEPIIQVVETSPCVVASVHFSLLINHVTASLSCERLVAVLVFDVVYIIGKL